MASSEMSDLFMKGIASSYVDASVECDDTYRSELICNSSATGETLLHALKHQLASCDSFIFCVAFVTDSGLQPLVQVLAELKARGVTGKLLTSTYLNFNKPEVFRKLLEYRNIETRIYQGNLHAKGYVFSRNGLNTIIVGSSNLTQTALTCNQEWNVLFHSYESGHVANTVVREFNSLWNSPSTQVLTQQWIDGYARFKATLPANREQRLPTYRDFEHVDVESATGHLVPNKMQSMALEALGVLHNRKEPRALLVSATGTGKTYLSAFDVLATKPRRILFLAHRKRILAASLKSYERLLGRRYTYGMHETGKSTSDTCVFAMCSTIARHLEDFARDAFDYIVIDEAHRVGSGGYQKIMEYFTPRFYLGMTATPNRTDGMDVFAMFNHVIAYQITLQDALANEMLVPFHYFGIADLEIDYESTDDFSLFNKLTAGERVRNIIQKINEYTVDKEHIRGLIFCNRNDEARSLSRQFNERGFRTAAVSGEDSDDVRNAAIARLESGELQYIFSVDIFNEGIDIPSVNQIIMLRRTESAIVFVQQLGRGLRKCDNKNYTLVLDFIGNFQKNFLVPVALSGDKTYNKDRLRTIVKGGGAEIPGASTVSFDRVAEARIYRAIDGGDFTQARFLKNEYMGLRQMLGRVPSLNDFDQNGSIDPLLIFKKFGSYHAFLSKYEDDYTIAFSEVQCSVLKFVSQKLANGKRLEDLFLLRDLITMQGASAQTVLCHARKRGVRTHSTILFSAANALSGAFFQTKGFVPLVMADEEGFHLMRPFREALENGEFRRQVLEVLDFGIRRHNELYSQQYKNTSFVLNAKYTYEEVCRLLGWDKNVNGQNIGGYKYDEKTNTYPVFINYDKDPSISDSIKYEDRFVSRSELIAISKQPRDLNSPEIQRLKAWPGNGMKTYLFVRKNKDDRESKEFYFLGEMYPTGEYRQIVMPVVNRKAVEITYRLDEPVRQDLFEFMVSDLQEAE